MRKCQRIKKLVQRVPMVLRYGVLLSAGIVVLKTIEYQLFSFKYSHELYSGLLALFFLAVGLIVGYVLLNGGPGDHVPRPGLLAPLTAAEQRVLEGLTKGCNNQQLADRNHVSVNTIKSHLKNLYRKLQVRNRAEAVALAKKQSLL